ncbi:hypothetical protein BC937DRAFT_90846 [Endogone sp. FLAS-F59071]|nr:hypothetical protein BC937DRAFT_90846 [Endogone sp. FLAS-F59071]|eukprot:RUS21973.1 hypothetical protein BC937DRAFT_90846 [Endogone sp. FLAS-F59071]
MREPQTLKFEGTSEKATLEIRPQATLAPSIPHIVIVSATWTRESYTATETELLLKSILIHARCSLHFTLVVDETSEPALRELFGRVARAKYDTTFSFVQLPFELIERRSKEWNAPVEHHSGTAGYAKFLLPEFLWWIDHIMLFDTDMLAGSDVCLLWNEMFDKSDKEETNDLAVDSKRDITTLFAWTPMGTEGFCSCVGLLHLERMRRAGWGSIRDEGTESNYLDSTYYGINLTEIFRKHEGGMEHGDQTMYILVWKAFRDRYPRMMLELSHSWNLDHCQGYYNINPRRTNFDAKSREPPYVVQPYKEQFFGIVHFNCFFGGNGYTAQSLGNWGIVYQWVEHYKWEWIAEGAEGAQEEHGGQLAEVKFTR